MSQSASSSFTSTYALTKGAPVGILGIGIGGGCGLGIGVGWGIGFGAGSKYINQLFIFRELST